MAALAAGADTRHHRHSNTQRAHGRPHRRKLSGRSSAVRYQVLSSWCAVMKRSRRPWSTMMVRKPPSTTRPSASSVRMRAYMHILTAISQCCASVSELDIAATQRHPPLDAGHALARARHREVFAGASCTGG